MDLTGNRYGRLVVVKRIGIVGHSIKWECVCDCGSVCSCYTHHLVTKKEGIKSCGCLKNELRQPDVMVCSKCGVSKPKEQFFNKSKSGTKHTTCKDCMRPIYCASKKARDKKVRYAALVAYSGREPKCKCCGEPIVEFLTIDHINGGGGEHRRKLSKSSGAIYRWLRDNSYPPGFQVLCWNCNVSKGLYGKCPHERSRESSISTENYREGH